MQTWHLRVMIIIFFFCNTLKHSTSYDKQFSLANIFFVRLFLDVTILTECWPGKTDALAKQE